LRRPRQHEYPKGPDIVIGFDSEWVFERPGENRILSGQFALLNAETDMMSFTFIRPKGPEKCRRIALDFGLAKALQRARKEGVIDRVPKSLTLAGHGLRGDLSTLKDFPELRRKAEAIRKTLATTTIPLSIEVPTKEGPMACNVRQVDTQGRLPRCLQRWRFPARYRPISLQSRLAVDRHDREPVILVHLSCVRAETHEHRHHH
jgi:hypothetical protein